MTNQPQAPTPEANLHIQGFTRWRLRDITVFGVPGEATPAGFAAVFRAFLADPTPRVLWDMREYALARLTHGKLRWLVSELMRSDLSKRPTGRSAFVCRGDDDYDAMRILIAYAEANDYDIELAVFQDIEEARCWLLNDPWRNRPEQADSLPSGFVASRSPSTSFHHAAQVPDVVEYLGLRDGTSDGRPRQPLSG